MQISTDMNPEEEVAKRNCQEGMQDGASLHVSETDLTEATKWGCHSLPYG
jgi:hypothetical protein